MRKNVASQIVGCQLVSTAAGAAVTSGTTTVYVTGDGGTQAVGSVGSGACTHEGQGFWTYAPAQAETNYDHVAFTFTNATAIPTTVQVYPTFPQTGDNFARIGAPVGASISADVAAVKTQTAAIEVDTQDLQARTPAALVSGRTDASVGAMAANVLTATAINADAITAAKIATGAIDADALADDAVTEIADGVHDEAVDGATTFRESVRLQNAALAGKASGLGTTTAVYRDLADTKDRLTATVDANGNRTAVTKDAS